MKRRRVLRSVTEITALAAVYFGAGRLGLLLAHVHPSATLVWPPAGIALAALLVLGNRVWPGIFAGACLCNLTTIGSVAASAGIATGNTLEALAGAWLVNRFAGGRRAFERAPDVFRFTLLSAFAAAAISPTIGVTSLCLGGFAGWADYTPIWTTWWLGDAAGILIASPALILLAGTGKRERWTREKALEAVLVLLVLIVVGEVVFFGGLSPLAARNYPIEYLCLLPLIWTAFRFGPREAASASLVLSVIAVWGTVRGYGPFHRASENEALLLLQAFLGVMAVTSAALAAVVSEHRRVQTSVSASEEHYRLLFETTPLATWVYDTETLAFLAVNEATVRRYGYSRDELLSMSIRDIRPPEEIPRLIEDLAVREGLDLGSIWRHRRKDGTELFVEVASHPITFSGRVGRLVLANDVTERLDAEKALRRSEEMLRSLVESAPDLIMLLDLGDRIQFINRTVPGISKERVLGTSAYDWVQPEDCGKVRETLERVRRTGVPDAYDVAGVGAHGKPAFYHVNVGPVKRDGSVEALLLIAADITERGALEEQLRQAQKMEAIGRLAGGIAHDFNNILTAILGYSEVALADLADGNEAVVASITEIHKAGERAAALTRQLLAYSRKQIRAPRVVDVNSVVTSMERMFARLIGEDIGLVLSLAPDAGRVNADPGQLEQVILNLALNGRDAMPKGGTLTIETRNVRLDESYTNAHPGSESGDYVMLATADTGGGMDAEARAHAFEPFFTTKEKGKGTGLGLATVYGIVKQSGGYIDLDSRPGEGTTFRIYLPRVDGEAEDDGAPRSTGQATGGSETILLAEDEEAIRSLARSTLTAYGYTVVAARDAHEALDAAERHAGTIDLLVTDVVLKGLSGRDLARRLAERRAGLTVLYMSGHTDEAIVHHGILYRGTNFLQKPFGPEALARKVREVLDRPQESQPSS